jgi:hypothetical protein
VLIAAKTLSLLHTIQFTRFAKPSPTALANIPGKTNINNKPGKDKD